MIPPTYFLKTLLLSFSLKHSFLSLPLIHLPPSTSLLSVFSPFTSQNIQFWESCNTVSTSSAFSLIAFQTAFFALFFMLLYLRLFSSELFCNIALCASFFLETASFTSSFHHQVFPLLLLPLFFPHTSSHAFETPSLKCPHKFGTPTSTNLVTVS